MAESLPQTKDETSVTPEKRDWVHDPYAGQYSCQYDREQYWDTAREAAEGKRWFRPLPVCP